MGDHSPNRSSGCGLLTAVFSKAGFWQKKSSSPPPSASASVRPANGNNFVKAPSSPTYKKQQQNSHEAVYIEITSSVPEAPSKLATKGVSNHPNNLPVYNQNQAVIPSGPTRDKRPPNYQQGYVNSANQQAYVNQGRKVPKDAMGLSGELENMIQDHQKNKGAGSLVRASSSNVMLFGNLGNLRQGGGGGGGGYGNSYNNVMEYLPKPAREETSYVPHNSYTSSVVKKNNGEKRLPSSTDGSLCRALSTRMDPEQLKIMGNEDYKNGNFAEALALYDAAISIDPSKASYRSNKSAALTALGRLLDGVFECREAIRIEPRYQRAHQRLATLYLRLGEVEKASYHHKHAGPEADPDHLAKVRNVQVHLNKCTEARRLRDWNTMIKETGMVMSAGADSAPQIYSLQAEALLKLNRHQDADETLTNAPKFNDDALTKFFGPIGSANLLVVQAQVDLAVGRFEDALAAAQRASQLDPNNKEVNMVMRKARAIAAARSRGNELFKASRFSEACNAYGEGLEHDPYNSILLCNRAACRSKLGQCDKAVEDCTVALKVRPSYSKARLRRADCNAKRQKWEAAIKDYEILLKETPDDEEVKKALSEAQMQLKRQRGS